MRYALCVLAVVENVGHRMREMARKLEDAAEDNERRMMLSSLALVDARHHSRAESERAFNHHSLGPAPVSRTPSCLVFENIHTPQPLPQQAVRGSITYCMVHIR